MIKNDIEHIKTDDHYLQVIEFQQIRKAGNGKLFRHIKLLDTCNQKSVNYVIFEDKRGVIWSDIISERWNKVIYCGEIRTCRITHQLLKEIRSHFELTIKEGDLVDLVFWDDDAMDPEFNEFRIERSLQEQIWRFRKLPKH